MASSYLTPRRVTGQLWEGGLAQSEQYATGSAQRELYPSEIGKMLVFLPKNAKGEADLKWQQRLADKVIAADAARRKAKEIVEQAKAIVEREIEKNLN